MNIYLVLVLVQLPLFVSPVSFIFSAVLVFFIPIPLSCIRQSLFFIVLFNFQISLLLFSLGSTKHSRHKEKWQTQQQGSPRLGLSFLTHRYQTYLKKIKIKDSVRKRKSKTMRVRMRVRTRMKIRTHSSLPASVAG